MKKTPLALVMIALFLLASLVSAARVDLSTAGKIVRLADPQISPDGKVVAVVVTRSNFAENRNDADIVLVDIATHAQRVLTHGRRGVNSPRWSPDGSRLAYLAQVETRAQIHVITVSGSEAGGDSDVVTKSPTGVQSFSWRPDGKAFAFAAFDEEPKREGEERFNRVFEIQNNHYLTQSAPLPSHLWIVATDGTGSHRVTSGSWTLPVAFPPGPPPPAPEWSADGKSFAIVKLATVYSGDFDQATIQIVDADTGKMHPFTKRDRHEGHPEFSPDGKSVSYWYPHEGQNKFGMDIFIAPAAGGEGTAVTTALDRNILRAIWMPDSKSVLIAANDHTTTGLWIQPTDSSAARKLDTGKIVAGGGFGLDASVSRDGRIVLAASEPLHPSELYYYSSASAKPERLTGFNDAIAALELGRTETVEWDGPDGYREDGVLTYPPDFQAGRKYPLVLYIHGGPRSASKEAFSARSQFMAAQGWLIFEPNYRGSDNLGNKYQAAIWNDAGAGPGRDVIAGLEMLKKRGIVDESKMAVSGWSYGGYMTTWLMGNYPMLWKAAVAGAAVTDLMDQYNLGDANVRRGASIGGSPYTDPARMKAYIDQSPITYGPKMRTPTLILTDTGDYRVTPTQSYRLYHVLRDNGVPVKFFAYPVTGHSPTDPVHQRDIDRRWIDWLKTYLGSAGPQM